MKVQEATPSKARAKARHEQGKGKSKAKAKANAKQKEQSMQRMQSQSFLKSLKFPLTWLRCLWVRRPGAAAAGIADIARRPAKAGTPRRMNPMGLASYDFRLPKLIS